MSSGPTKSLLYRYALQQCTDEEQVFVELWLASDPKVKDQLEMIRSMLNHIQEDKPENKKSTSEFVSPSTRSMYWLWYILVAIVFIAIVCWKIFKA
ncbi:MAG: hypothetical protein IPM48_10380 [Saprospiraceae bacterium]|nr:hypothetical protein [Saprospiraceae bacterium]